MLKTESENPSRPTRSPRRNLLWWIRMLAIGIWFAVVSILLLPVALVRFKNPANSFLFLQILVPLARRILGLEVVCRARRTPWLREPSVLVMNHQASLDILLNADFYPRTCVVIAKRSLALIPVFGWFFYLAGNLFINRSNRRQSLSQLESAEAALTRRGLSVWIFPEGTRSLDRGLGKFKKGAFHLAIGAQAPVVPIVSSSYFGHLDFSRWKSGTVLVEILEPISTKGLQLANVPTLVTQTETRMREAIVALDTELGLRTSTTSTAGHSRRLVTDA